LDEIYYPQTLPQLWVMSPYCNPFHSCPIREVCATGIDEETEAKLSIFW